MVLMKEATRAQAKRVRGPDKQPRFRAATRAPRTHPPTAKAKESARVAKKKGNPGRPVGTTKSELTPAQEAKLLSRLINQGEATVFRIDQSTWLFPKISFNGEYFKDSAKQWTHVRRATSLTKDQAGRPILETAYMCSSCPVFDQQQSCSHVAVFDANQSLSQLDALTPLGSTIRMPCVQCPRLYRSLTGTHVLLFSVSYGDACERVVVQCTAFSREEEVLCSWHCAKDGYDMCCHVRVALQTAIDSEDDVAGFVALMTRCQALGEDDSDDELDLEAVQAAEKCEANAEREERSVSNQPVPPPIWAGIPSDKLRADPSSYLPIPDIFRIASSSRARCGQVVDAHPDLVHETRECVLYDVDAARKIPIEVDLCPKCRGGNHCTAGPELCSYGVFNHNNKQLYTHRLLNTYSSQFSTSETPFESFAQSVQNAYEESACPIKFVHPDVFRAAWHSFSTLQDLDNDFVCPICGMTPKHLIVDGVTAGFGRRKVATLKPPTIPDPHRSPDYPDVRPIDNAPLVKLASIRRLGRVLLGSESNSETDEHTILLNRFNEALDLDTASAAAKAPKTTKKTPANATAEGAEAEATKRLEQIERVTKSLSELNDGVANLFQKHVPRSAGKVEKGSRRYIALLAQLLAHESVLQFAPVQSLPILDIIAQGKANTTLLEGLMPEIPTFAFLALDEHARGAISEDLKSVAAWVARHARNIHTTLCSKHPLQPLQEIPSEDPWKTGCFYPTPQIRYRPQYSSMKHDGTHERSIKTDADGIGCPKYYSSYGRKGLTGGLCALWCPHGICVGFHSIPKGEGRNDVFSAVYTRWPVAPKLIVYDFACALAPYCMLREPEFFRDTKFLVDEFHSKGHSHCSAACMMKTYKGTSSMFHNLNTSAAECGNSGLKRIRKSLSYMGQRRAIRYTKTYLSLWNRRKLRKMMKHKAL